MMLLMMVPPLPIYTHVIQMPTEEPDIICYFINDKTPYAVNWKAEGNWLSSTTTAVRNWRNTGED